jgi:hypothetical protein
MYKLLCWLENEFYILTCSSLSYQYLSIYLSTTCPFIHPSIHPSIHLSLSIFIRVCVYIYIYLYLGVSVSLSISACVPASLCLQEKVTKHNLTCFFDNKKCRTHKSVINMEKRSTYMSLSNRSNEFLILGKLMKQSFKIDTYVLNVSLFQISHLLVPTSKIAVKNQQALRWNHYKM